MLDILIKNGMVFDGTGNPWYKADVSISKNKIDNLGNKIYRHKEDIPKDKKPEEPTKYELQAICDKQGIKYKKSDTNKTLKALLQGD